MKNNIVLLKGVLILLTCVFFSAQLFAQQPQILRDTGSKYVHVKSTKNNNNFIQVAQFKIGDYLTLGNYGKTNASWIGQNAILDYSSYNGLGSNGDNNKFIPTYAGGMALVVNFGIADGKMTGFTHNWGGSSSQVDILSFNKAWELGPTKSFFLENVGIGTESPSAKLEIKAIGNGVDVLKLGTERPWVFRQEGTGSSTHLVFKDLSGGKKFIIQSYDGNNSFLFSPSSGQSYFSGKMGIGKVTPTAKLHVAGNIISTEIKVENVTGADFVFDPNYNLMPLTETEAYIKHHHHLPEVPSAAQMEANGIELGKMNMLLLQKIEELTLHMIEQQKEIQELKNEVHQLKSVQK